MTKTDLFGKPLNGKPFELNKWQKRQAALLYHFASIDYLKGLKVLVDDFVDAVDGMLETAQQEGRDQHLVSERWGVRDTSANFSTYGFSALMEFRQSVNQQIAEAAIEYYHGTGFNQCAGVIRELSLNWATDEERIQFEDGMDKIGAYADYIDGVMHHRRNDSILDVIWAECKHLFRRLPKFRVRTDVEAESGRRPVRTGVWVPQDDPHGTLQFGWTGNSDGNLDDCRTFNELGLQGVAAVGRDSIWTNDPRLLPVVRQPKYFEAFKQNNFLEKPDHLNDAEDAMLFISGEGFTTRPCKWYFVEQVDGEFEELEDEPAAQETAASQTSRCEANKPCPRTGFWLTPASANSRRHFQQGEAMPELNSSYGKTIWQWDSNQGA